MHIQTLLLRDQEWLLRRRVAWKKGRTGVILFLSNLSPSRSLGRTRRRQQVALPGYVSGLDSPSLSVRLCLVHFLLFWWHLL